MPVSTRSSGGTKFERNCFSCGVRLASPDALILSRMRFTSSRFSSWTDCRSTRFQFASCRSGGAATASLLEPLASPRFLEPAQVQVCADVSAQVREVRHAAGRAVEPAVDRHDDRDPHQPARLERQDAPDVDLVGRPEACEGQHDAVDRRRCADDRRVRRQPHVQQRAGDAAEEVEPEEPARAKPLLDARAEEEQPQHVERDVPECRRAGTCT